MKLRREFRNFKVFAFDGDGVLWRGRTPIPSAIKVLNKLLSMGKTVVLVTNNSTKSRIMYQEMLRKMGINLPLTNIYCSSYGAAVYLSEHGYRSAYVVGEDGLKEELVKAGIKVKRKAEAVVVGMDRKISYSKIATASRLVRDQGAFFLATNRDATFPTEKGEYPGAGSIVAAIEVAAKKPVDVDIGKPQPYMFQLIMKDHDAEPSEIVVIGDRLETDIAAAKRISAKSILVLTGVAKKEDVEKSREKPDYVLRDLSELLE